jgi:hypothetical protein
MICSCNILLYANAIHPDRYWGASASSSTSPCPRDFSEDIPGEAPDGKVRRGAGVVKMWSCEGPVAKKGGEPQQVTMV